MNGLEFCKKYGIKDRHIVRKWYKAGYLGKTTVDEKTGVYSIPDDIPLPHKANSRIKRIPTLFDDLIEAAGNLCSVYPSMYPNIPEDVLNNQIQHMCELEILQISYTHSGDPFLELLPLGRECYSKVNKQQRIKIWQRVYKTVILGATVTQAFASVWPYVQTLIK